MLQLAERGEMLKAVATWHRESQEPMPAQAFEGMLALDVRVIQSPFRIFYQ